jgi:hypothetical protein
MATLMTDIRPAVADRIDLIAAVAGFTEQSAGSSPIGDKLSGTRYLGRYLSNLARLGELAGELGYGGLRRACPVIRETVEALRVRDNDLAAQTLSAVDSWAELVRWYLELPPEAGATEVLVHHLRLPHWVSPLDQADAQVLMTLLMEERRKSGPDEA